MGFERCKKRLRSDRSGVSEVVGNILILMITVILFSAIVAYVNQIPVPEMTTKADFAASISFETAGNTTASLTVTHAGGVVLEAADTAILLNIDSSTQFYDLGEDADFPYSKWSTGTDWTKSFTVPSPSSEITVTVIDMAKSSSIWVSQVSGGAGGNAPIILQRYVDSNVTSSTADPVKAGDDFSFYVKVFDLDNDLDTSTSGVYINSSQLPDGSDVDTYESLTSDGWFRFDFSDITDIVGDVDGKIIKIHAWDLAGHETVSSFVMTVTVLPSDTIYVPDDDSPVEYTDGLPPYISFTSGGQGYGLYGQNLTSGRADTSDPRSIFTKDEVVFIRVGSTYLKNLMGSNSISIIDTRTGFNYVPTFNGSSTAAAPFYSYTVSGTANIYECQFNTTGLPPSAYTLEIDLKSTGDTSWVYRVDAPMLLEEEGSSISFAPAIWTYKNSSRSPEEWGTSKTEPFVVYSSDSSVIYVSIKVQDASAGVSPSVDDVRIVDMRGDTELHGTPPSGSMLTEWTAVTTPLDNQTYQFEISLRLNNGDQWLGGTHAYALKISRFADENEGVYSLSKMIFIRASTAKADFFVGASGFMTGTSNFVNPQYLYYIQNNNFFTKRTIYDYANAPSSADNYAVSALALGDLDGDGDKDILMGQYGSHKLYYIENSMNTFGVWQEASEITRPSTDSLTADINWIATGDINGDGDVDFAYSTSYYSSAGRTVVLYNNTYGATGVLWKQYSTANSGVRKISLEDMTGDGRDDLIVLANGYVYVYDLLDWDPDSPLATVPESGSSNIIDFDIADVNGDGMLDIVTVDDSASGPSYTGVYVNYYVNSTSPVTKTLTGTVATPTEGRTASGLISDTFFMYGNALELRENATAEDAPVGSLQLDMQTETLTSDLDQQLVVRAKVSSGAAEGFYIWYSSSGVTYTPMIYIPPSATSYDNYTVRLPPTVAGKAIYIRVTDTLSSEASASSVDTLYLDFLAVQTDTHGGYTSHVQVAERSERFICARAGNLNGITGDGDLGLEVIAAKEGTWKAYNHTAVGTWSALAGWTDSSATFYCKGSDMISLHSTMASDENPVKAILSNSAPRLFWVVDVNGDGFDDIIVVNSTVNADITSQIALYLNMYPSVDNWYYYVVKDIAAEYNTVEVRGGITYLAVSNIITT